jgi:hypothetical protein
MASTMDERLTIRMDTKRRDLLEEYAKCEGMPASLIVRHLVYRFLEQQQKLSFIPRIGAVL